MQAIRNIALVGHGSVGKTSLADALVYACGRVSRLGKVTDKTSLFDYLPEEQERGITINAAQGWGEYRKHRLTFIDTPGYADFFGEAVAALHVCDSAALVVCAFMGVEVQTERLYQRIHETQQPCLVVINKLDAERAEFERVLQQLRDQLGMRTAPLFVPLGEQQDFRGVVDVIDEQAYVYEAGKGTTQPVPGDLAERVASYREALIEAAAEGEDELLEKYLEEETLTKEEIWRGLKKSTASGTCVPVVCVSAEKQIGLDRVLSAMLDCLPSPADRYPEITGTKPGTEESVTRRCTAEDPFAALVFKTITDPYVGRLTYFRVWSGEAKADQTVFNPLSGQRERFAQIFRAQGKELEPVGGAGPGELVAVAKLEHTATGQTLCDESSPIVLPAPEFPKPSLSLAVSCTTRGEEDKLGTALARLAEEDPTFTWHRDNVTGETLITGMADLHLDILCKRMEEKFGVHVETRRPRIAYRETVRSSAKVQGRYKRQTGGRGQFGDVWLELSPLPRGAGFEFEDKIVGGAIPGKFIPSVQKGVEEAMAGGILAGYPLVDVKVVLYDGSYHPVDSSDLAFKIAGSLALKAAAEKANPYLLEPIVNLEVRVPESCVGDVIGDLNGKRGRILGVDPEGKEQVVRAQVPLAEVQRYTTDLRSLSSGRGSFTVEFADYEEVPAHLAEQIIAEAKQRAENE